MHGMTVIKAIEGNNPKTVVEELIESNPGKEKNEIFELFRRRVASSQELTRAVQWYFFINMYEYKVTSRQSVGGRSPSNNAVLASKRLENRIIQDEIVSNIKQQLVLLDLLMPNEKLMRDCTGAEMAAFGSRYQKISDRVGKAQIVGEVLNEGQIREIMK